MTKRNLDLYREVGALLGKELVLVNKNILPFEEGLTCYLVVKRCKKRSVYNMMFLKADVQKNILFVKQLYLRTYPI